MGESVRASLICRADLPETGLSAIDVVIDGETESIVVDCHGLVLHAWLNVCPHEGRRLDYAPGKFLIDKGRLVCAAHGATFRLPDGECVAGPCRGQRLRAVSIETLEGGELRFALLPRGAAPTA